MSHNTLLMSGFGRAKPFNGFRPSSRPKSIDTLKKDEQTHSAPVPDEQTHTHTAPVPVPQDASNQKTDKVTKIKIGLNNPLQSENTGLHVESNNLTSSSTSNKTMSELCDLSLFRSKSKKRKNSSDVDHQIAVPKRTKENEPLRRLPKNRPDQIRGTGPEVEIIDGQIVIKESSLLLQDETELYEDDYEEVEESQTRTSTYATFADKPVVRSWGVEETRRFYEALKQCGTDFSLMLAFFPGRTRRQLKLKFFREERQLPELVKRVLSADASLDVSPFVSHFGNLDMPEGCIEKKEPVVEISKSLSNDHTFNEEESINS